MDELLFNLLILGSVSDVEGCVWQAQKSDYYVIECMPFLRAKVLASNP